MPSRTIYLTQKVPTASVIFSPSSEVDSGNIDYTIETPFAVKTIIAFSHGSPNLECTHHAILQIGLASLESSVITQGCMVAYGASGTDPSNTVGGLYNDSIWVTESFRGVKAKINSWTTSQIVIRFASGEYDPHATPFLLLFLPHASTLSFFTTPASTDANFNIANAAGRAGGAIYLTAAKSAAAINTQTDHALFGFGFVDAAGNQYAAAYTDEDGQLASDSYRSERNDVCLIGPDVNGANSIVGSHVTFSDGGGNAELNISAAGSQIRGMALYLSETCSLVIDDSLDNGNPYNAGTYAHGLGETPAAALFASTKLPSATVTLPDQARANGQFSIGCAVDPELQASAFLITPDNVAANDKRGRAMSLTHCLFMAEHQTILEGLGDNMDADFPINMRCLAKDATNWTLGGDDRSDPAWFAMFSIGDDGTAIPAGGAGVKFGSGMAGGMQRT